MTVFSIIKHRTARYSVSRPGNPMLCHLMCNSNVKSWGNFLCTVFNGMETTCGKMRSWPPSENVEGSSRASQGSSRRALRIRMALFYFQISDLNFNNGSK